MAQNIQIVPKYSFPYVETVINDYTVYTDPDVNAVSEDSVVRYIYPFVSSKGIDNKFIRKRTRDAIVSAYGDTNWKQYGQPLMQALNVADAPNTEVWCMRVMPSDAAYAHNIISAYYKGDTEAEVADASKRKFKIKYVQKQSQTPVYSMADLDAAAVALDGDTTTGVYVDGEGYAQIPGVVTLYAAGRGKYGNNYRVRVVPNVDYEKEYGIKYYTFEVRSTESGVRTEATYNGSLVTTTKYDRATFITDILADADDGVVPLFVKVDEAGIDDLYNAYVEWVSDPALFTALTEELDLASIAVEEKSSALKALKEGGSTSADELATAEEELATANAAVALITSKINAATNIPEIDAFDALLGFNVASLKDTNPFIEIVKAEDTDSDVVAWNDAVGVTLSAGSDGSFENPPEGLTVEDVITECYIKAFDGTYDKRILTSKRIKAKALWDANYPMPVKAALAKLAVARNDAICYLDCGIMSSFGDNEINNLIMDFDNLLGEFGDDYAGYNISKNVHHYYVKEATTKKRVPVTITYFLSRQYADHVLNYGSHIPFVKSYAQLSGHVKDSLTPSVEDFEVALKETFAEHRFNFFETVDDNIYQRAMQNTAQVSSSDLLEENNVAVLYDIKRIVEADITDRLYDFSDAESRQRFRNYEIAKFADWSGREVEKFDIDFRMSDWEKERNILHAYIDVTFRGLQKRAILELDINRRVASESAE